MHTLVHGLLTEYFTEHPVQPHPSMLFFYDGVSASLEVSPMHSMQATENLIAGT